MSHTPPSSCISWKEEVGKAEVERQKRDWQLRRRLMDLIPPQPRCRECADACGACLLDGFPCDPVERALAMLRRALVKHPVDWEHLHEPHCSCRVDQQALAAGCAHYIAEYDPLCEIHGEVSGPEGRESGTPSTGANGLQQGSDK